MKDLFDFGNRSIGFERALDRLMSTGKEQGGFPPYNIYRNGEHITLELAVAGYDEENLDVHYQDGILTVTGESSNTQENDDREYVYRGIARRNFTRKWALAETIVVNGASLDNGMLTVHMENVVPEEKKSRTIPIGSGTQKVLKG